MSERGRQREIGSYHAQRGWFYSGVQKVANKWIPILGKEIVLKTFISVRRPIEEGTGVIHVETSGASHRQLLCELIAALDELHDPKNPAGWLIRLCGVMKNKGAFRASEDKSSAVKPNVRAAFIHTYKERKLLSYADIKQEIIARGGPVFEEEALRKAAGRLKLTGSAHEHEQSIYRGYDVPGAVNL